jgi:hypothetical protein
LNGSDGTLHTLPQLLQTIISTLLSAGVVAVVLGIFGNRWLKRVAAKYDHDLENLKARYASELEAYKTELERSKQLLQAEIDKTFLVTKVHFETEFNALKAVFSLLAEIRLQLPSLRPVFRIARADETKEERLAELVRAVRALETVYNQLVMTSENLSPFYPNDVYLQVSECERVVRMELSSISLAGPNALAGNEMLESRKNVEEFLVAYAKVSNLIRERIARLAIVRTS